MVRRETVWHYPMPLGAYGSLGYRDHYGFDHVKTELLAPDSSRIDKRFAYRYRAPRSDRRSAHSGVWVWSKPAWADSVPYRARELRAAIVAGADVWVCEGEADCDALVALGLVATTSHRGAEGWTEAMAEWFGGFRGGRVTICADADPTGAYVAAKTYRLLEDSGVYPSALRVVVVADEVGELGADVRDHLAAGYTVNELIEIDINEVNEVARMHAASVGTRSGGSGPYRDDPGERELRAMLEYFGWNPIKVS